MNYEMIVESLNKVRPGAFTRLGYKTEVPIHAEYSKLGYKVEKICNMTVRFGIKYGNIAEVIKLAAEKVASDSRPRVSNEEMLVPNKLYRNLKSGKIYLSAYPCKQGRNTTRTYVITIPTDSGCVKATMDDLGYFKSLVLDSYFNQRETSIFKVNIDNVFKIGNVNCPCD